MSAPHQYHQPNAPDSPIEDADSDLELELRELDPESLPSGAHSSGLRSPVDGRSFGGRIALRNLRVGRLRGGTRGGHSRRSEDEDVRGLLHDDERSSGSLGLRDDDAPLLAARTGRRASKVQEGPLSRWKAMLPDFISRAPPSPGLVQESEPEADVDHDPSSNRTIAVGQLQTSRFPANAVSNAKYTPWSFLPRTLYNEFSFFFNLYFLMVALSQIIPVLRIGYLSTYIAPLAFVLMITMGKEAFDDIARRRRDAEANAELYTVLRFDQEGQGLGQFARSMGFGQRTPKPKRRSGRRSRDRLAELDEEEATTERHKNTATSDVTEIMKASKDIKVGDILKLGKDQRVPADIVILKTMTSDAAAATPKQSAETLPPLIDTTHDSSDTTQDTGSGGDGYPAPPAQSDEGDEGGEAFIRTDQLDGETDWKLRLASPLSQRLDVGELTRLRVVAGKPAKQVNEFVGTIELGPKTQRGYDPHINKPDPVAPTGSDDQTSEVPSSSLTIDNTAWANTILASSSTVLGVVVYTGSQTRQALSTSPSRSKTGLLDYEINSLTKILCFLTLALSLILVAFKRTLESDGSEGRKWYVAILVYLILFSTIIPISLRVNLDMGKSVYAWFIEHDSGIPGTVVRTSTIPEDLGRIEYLLTDKTGTLTQNEMELKKIHVGTVSYANDAMDEVSSYVRQGFAVPTNDGASLITPSSAYVAPSTSATRTRREIGSRVRDVVLALGLCHNVTPTIEEENGKTVTAYQASSPDEIAIIRWTEQVGLRLLHRDRHSMVLQSTHAGRTVVRVRILNIFPFTSDSKRMGVVVQFAQSLRPGENANPEDSEIWFYQKGADTVMASIVAANDWLEEETANMAREGLRTLVVGRKKLSYQKYQEFTAKYSQASLSFQGRDAAMADIVNDYLEQDLELLGVTGVEDKLQRDVKPSLELLRNAGIKIWMLTGDKVETARCVAVSSKLVARGQYIHTIAKVKRKDLAYDSLDFLRSKPDACMLIDGESLALMLTSFRDEFISVAVGLPAVVACRCSPTQKADIARLIRAYTKKRVCCIGDGGNDVSMIQAADVGVGIVGKEGRQASLAADFSIEQFCYLKKLLVWHGRNSYKRSAKLAQFVIHRGLVISVCQTMYSIASRFEPIALYKDWLLVGYATVYTMMPVFSLVLDRDVDESLAEQYPELYKELTTGRSLSYRSFFIWVAVSIYQGGFIQGLSQILVGLDDFQKMVAVSFTALVVNELLMVAAEITTWHVIMWASILGTAALYFGTVPFLDEYFDLGYVASVAFWWKVLLILAISVGPPYAVKIIGRTINPPNYRKVQAI